MPTSRLPANVSPSTLVFGGALHRAACAGPAADAYLTAPVPAQVRIFSVGLRRKCGADRAADVRLRTCLVEAAPKVMTPPGSTGAVAMPTPDRSRR
jgi:hypothetical protein